MENVFFTADEHHGHESMIGYVLRPFKNAAHASKIVIEFHNDTVNDDSVVYHLGDFSMIGPNNYQYYESVMKKYRRVAARHLVLGNHDQLKPNMYLDLGFSSVHTAFWFFDEGKKYALAHDPCVFQYGFNYDVGLCGHIHKLWSDIKGLMGQIIVNVGVDVWGYHLAAFSSIKTLVMLREQENECERY